MNNAYLIFGNNYKKSFQEFRNRYYLKKKIEKKYNREYELNLSTSKPMNELRKKLRYNFSRQIVGILLIFIRFVMIVRS